MLLHGISLDFGRGWPSVRRLKPERLYSVGVHDETRLVCIVTGMCRSLAEILAFFDPWSDSIFQCAACRNIRASLSFGNEAARPSAVSYPEIPSWYVIFMKHLVRRASRACPFEHYPLSVQSLCAVVLVGVPRTVDAGSSYRCDTCRAALFLATLAKTSLAIGHFDSLVSTED